MAARPRRRTYTNVPNLYVKQDRRYSGISCQYKDQRTGKFKGLGPDLQRAEKIARQLNVLIGQQMLDDEMKALLAQGGDNKKSIRVGTWLEEYMNIQHEKLQAGEIKKGTLDGKRWALSPVLKKYKNIKLSDLNTVLINKILQSYIKENKTTMAQRIRTCLIDVFAEAIAAGHFPADKPNPAAVTKSPRPKVRRSRLTLETFNAIMEWGKCNQPAYLWRAYLFALVTGQRLNDVGKAQFKDVKVVNGVKYLEVVQGKTKTKLLIPVDLRLNAIDVSLKEVIAECRDKVVSAYLFHHPKTIGKAAAGSKVRTKSLTLGFTEAVRALKKDWGESDPPSFHELRSLSERLYRQQGVNTQELLGHKHQTTTDT
ncbi:tyrosine-type recombinase/integrase [Oceanospirillum sediminis]|uniref:Tyrosine-type recombinase/integrase n=1 Tax=Oceanospirillum sediminis TaxID=2760088 RepID=A0A839IVW7_9GAMM|nr:tyrosine-type recombinase/integrase [Oceanospirillum sediminis]MBB1489495.1 tyrosine-type recombinase/integrase [Oceanospirillum sediminis]